MAEVNLARVCVSLCVSCIMSHVIMSLSVVGGSCSVLTYTSNSTAERCWPSCRVPRAPRSPHSEARWQLALPQRTMSRASVHVHATRGLQIFDHAHSVSDTDDRHSDCHETQQTDSPLTHPAHAQQNLNNCYVHSVRTRIPTRDSQSHSHTVTVTRAGALETRGIYSI